HGRGVGAERAALVRDLAGRFLTQVADDDVRPFLRESQRVSPADALRRAGDYGDLVASRMRRRYHLAEKTVNDRALAGVLLTLRTALELVLQGLEGDGAEAAQARRNRGDRPVDVHLASMVHRMCRRRRSVRVGGVDGRIERLERIERAVGRHRSALLGVLARG